MREATQTLSAIMCVVGARPNYMKMAPLIRAFRNEPGAPSTLLVHTGQHYDVAMHDRLFADLNLRPPDINLEVGSGTHAQQRAEIMRRFEPVVDDAQPSCVVVVGDVNSTLACSLVCVKKAIPVVHVEAGYAASIARCRRKSTGCLPTRSAMCSTRPSVPRPTTCAAKASR